MEWHLPVQEEAGWPPRLFLFENKVCWLRLFLFENKVENITKRATRMHSKS